MGAVKEKNVPILRFLEFKDNWQLKPLKSVSTINPKSEELPIQFTYVDLESVKNGILEKQEVIEKEGAPSRAQRLLKKNDVLFQMVRPYQKNNFFFDRNGDYVASTGYAQIRAKYNAKYLFQFLHTEKFVKKVILRCTGTSYPAINSTDLATIKINLPSLPEQTKIANFLTSVDDKISLLIEKKEALEEYKKGMMQKIFSQEIRFKADNGEDFEDWEEKRLGEIGEIITGKTPPTSKKEFWNGEIQFVTPTDITNDKYQITTIRSVNKNVKMRILPSKTIMFTCVASIGKMALSLYPCITNQQINSLIPYSNFNNEFIYYSILNITEFIKSTQSNTTLPIINKTDFSKFSVDIPSISEQNKIANFISAIDEKIELVTIQIEETKEYKKGLLQGMFC